MKTALSILSLKHKAQRLLKNFESSAFIFFFVFSFVLTAPATSHSANYCTKLSKNYQEKISKKFNQNPFLLVESFLSLPLDKNIQRSVDSQNKLIVASFDINRIYKSNLKNFRSKALSKVLFDWVRTQYFSNLSKNFYSKNNFLFKKNFDLLSSIERRQMSRQKMFSTKIKRQLCSKDEASLLGCSSVYVVTSQSTAALSCKEKSLKKAFESKFYLSFSKKYGFKILDVSISGKRIVLDSMKHMLSLLEKGFNADAIASHIATLSLAPHTFRLPQRQVNTRAFLAGVKKLKSGADANRLPSSL